jgi:hypothetical protein
MTNLFQGRGLASWGRIALAGVAAAVLMTGCGGGGGGGGNNDGGNNGQTVTITGKLEDKTTSNVLPNRTVAIQGLSLSATSDSSGNFTINTVPVQSVILSITDSNGVSDGTVTYDLSKYSGNPRNIGIVTLDLSNLPPPPPV